MKRGHIILIVVGLIGLIALGMWGIPTYQVWAAERSGRAVYEEAVWSRRATIAEAQADSAAAHYWKMAEVIRAQGLAEAMATTGMSPSAYTRWQMTEVIYDKAEGLQIMYIPTEAGMPITEAGRAVYREPEPPVVLPKNVRIDTGLPMDADPIPDR